MRAKKIESNGIKTFGLGDWVQPPQFVVAAVFYPDGCAVEDHKYRLQFWPFPFCYWQHH